MTAGSTSHQDCKEENFPQASASKRGPGPCSGQMDSSGSEGAPGRRLETSGEERSRWRELFPGLVDEVSASFRLICIANLMPNTVFYFEIFFSHGDSFWQPVISLRHGRFSSFN